MAVYLCEDQLRKYKESGVYLERPEVINKINAYEQEELVDELLRVTDTIEIIDEAIDAPDFNAQDAREIKRSREFFEGRRQLLRRVLAGESISRAS